MRITSGHRLIADGRHRVPGVLTGAAVGLALLLTFLLDRATGSAPVQHLFYVPIVLAAIRFGHRGGLIAAASAIVLYHVANPVLWSFRYEHTDIVQILLFVAVGLVTAKLSDDAWRLRQLAMTDDLTGLHNLRSFEQKLVAMLDEAHRTRTPLSVLMVDLDRLKVLNDTHGHLKGAAAVQTVGRIIAEQMPASAVACRFGGDEFVVAITCCDRVRACRLAEDLREAVRSVAPVLDGRAFPAGTLSVSVGVVSAMASRDDDPPLSGARLFADADAALYAAKASGRNRVAVRDAVVRDRVS